VSLWSKPPAIAAAAQPPAAPQPAPQEIKEATVPAPVKKPEPESVQFF
jgi:hypothetical protein